MANAVQGLISEWQVHHVIVKIDRKQRGGSDETCVSVGEIEIPCIYFLCETKGHKSSV